MADMPDSEELEWRAHRAELEHHLATLRELARRDGLPDEARDPLNGAIAELTAMLAGFDQAVASFIEGGTA